MATNFQPSSGGLQAGKALVVLLVIVLFSIVLYKKVFKKVADYTLVPKEMQINYLPADYKLNVDEEDALAILSNPHRYRREFNDLVFKINTSILSHVANRMGLSDSVKTVISKEYEKHHPYLRDMYFEDFVAIKDTTSILYQTWYDNEAKTSVDALNEIASKYTCFMINHIITTVVKTEGGSIFGKGNKVETPCGIAMTEALRPLIKRMDERAAVADFGRAKGLLQEKVEKTIGELATMEVRDKKGISKQMQTKIWGLNVSSTDVDITAISVLKVGFNLKEFLDISVNSSAGTVVVTLPQPVILSHEVHPKVEKLDIGWLREVKTEDFNKNIDLLRSEFRREALESDIMEKSKKQARELLDTMMGPLVKSLGSRYKLVVRFKENPQSRENTGRTAAGEVVRLEE
ncbi:MAG TPA: DUF4230 domain-containing protein [Saprospiraceae bacterium]|nr:DUF4230 domain-containing protein [Saprospiraceae bacterium]